VRTRGCGRRQPRAKGAGLHRHGRPAGRRFAVQPPPGAHKRQELGLVRRGRGLRARAPPALNPTPIPYPITLCSTPALVPSQSSR